MSMFCVANLGFLGIAGLYETTNVPLPIPLTE